MTVNELRHALYTLISDYFADSDTVVVWSEQRKSAKTGNTFVTLKLGDVQKTQYTIDHYDKETGGFSSWQPSQATLTVQLFTHGGVENITDECGNEYTVSVNTAMNDLLDLEHYLMSGYGVNRCYAYDIYIVQSKPVQDISAVTDTQYEYRAVQEYTVSFTQGYTGYAGISKPGWKPTASGGGTKRLADKQISDVDPDGIEIEQNYK